MPARSASAIAFGRAVRALRAERGLSQEAVSLRGDLSRGFYGRVERGDANATFETIVKVSRGLEVPAAELVTLAESYLSPPP